MKKIFILGLALFSITNLAFAQDSEGWAAGFIRLIYAGDGSETCNDPTPYHVELRFYRDYVSTADPLPNVKQILYRNNNIPVALDAIDVSLFDDGQVDQYCLQGNPVATEYGWYRTTQPINLQRGSNWEFLYVGEFRSTENNNIRPGQTFAVKTTLTNTACNFTFNGEKYVNTPNTTIEFERPHPVLSFCSGIDKRYNFQVPIIEPDNINDNIDNHSFVLGPVLAGNLASVNYEPPFFFNTPFPSSSSVNLENNTGVFSFSPSDPFASATTIVIGESKKIYELTQYCPKPGGGCLPSELKQRVDIVNKPVSETRVDYRIIFDDNCNKRLPEFENMKYEFDPIKGQDVLVSTYNPSEDAYEINCGTTELIFNLSNPMFCHTLDRNDFRIGLGYNNTDEIYNVIDDVEYFSCSNENEFDQIRIQLHDPIGPGEYNIFFRYGDNDSTTILNRCDFDIPIDSPWVKLYVNDNYIYEHPFEDTVYCDPANVLDGFKGIKVHSGLQEGNVLPPARVFFTWRQNPLDLNSEVDTIFPENKETFPESNPGRYYTNLDGYKRSSYDVWVDDSQAPPGTKIVSVNWEVGVGLDYSIYDPFTNELLEEKICYDTDEFTLTKYLNPPVEVPDYDLCPEDEWPLVDLDSMVENHNALEKDFYWEAYDEFPKSIPPRNELADSTRWTIVSTGESEYTVPGVMVNRYNFFVSNVPLQVGTGANAKTCIESDTFIVVKELVKAEIGRDSTICPGEQYVIRNDYDYLVPDSMSYQWYYNDELVEGNDTDTIMIDERGEYKLLVYKNTVLGTYCVGKDSVFINVADSLYPPEITCTEVTFENGQVLQRFEHNHVEGADLYQLRDVSMDDSKTEWAKRNIRNDEGLVHYTTGPQMRAQVRGVNNEVPEDAVCRFGPPSNIAEACEVIIKPTNVFTPNGDGVNDYLAFDLLELYPGSKLQVFNRWGKLIYEDDSYYNDWDGEDYPAGTYFYVLDINDEAYGIFKGSFTIIRD